MTIVDRRIEAMHRAGAGRAAGRLPALDNERDGARDAAGEILAFARLRATPLSMALAVFAAIFCVFLFQSVAPAFNEDDVVQAQKLAQPDMLPQGRWLYAFLYYVALGGNPAPVISSAIGLGVLLAAALRQAAFIGLSRNGARLAFALVSCVSIYYEHLFSYDSARLIYPLANLMVIWGVVRASASISLGAWSVAVGAFALAPAIYASALMYGATSVLVAAVAWTLRDRSPRRALVMAGKSLAAAALGMATYAVVTDALYSTMGWELGYRAGVDPFAIATHWRTFLDLLSTHSLALLTGASSAYFPVAYHLLSGSAYAVCGWLLARRLRASAAGAFAWSAMAATLVSPFCLIFISVDDQYLPRSLYAYATAQAGFFAIALDWLLASPRDRRAAAGVAAAIAAFIALNAVLINQRAYDEWLAWQSDKSITERIIVRIDGLLADADPDAEMFPPSRESAAGAPIPLAVFGISHWRAGPRGDIQTIRLFRHSRERVFSLLEPRFAPATGPQRDSVRGMIDGRAPWPAAGSVFLADGVVVVVLSDEGVDRW
ncbi:MAG: hypothetical protein GC152_16145 [Alphaproteobacteria bacterium]|nr:hypothetical protein [Alphaproteobacteria bacterium]